MDRSANMRAIRSEGMKPEMDVRRLVHGMGYRYRLHRRDLAGKPDMVFPSRQKIIFLHGCFWHQHSELSCRDGHIPKSNLDYWGPKLSRNVERDARNLALLEAEGWGVMVVWECEIKESKQLAARLRDFLEKTGAAGK